MRIQAGDNANYPRCPHGALATGYRVGLSIGGQPADCLTTKGSVRVATSLSGREAVRSLPRTSAGPDLPRLI